VKLIIHSRHNPCLCHALLESVERSHTPCTTAVLYEAGDDPAQRGYALVAERFHVPLTRIAAADFRTALTRELADGREPFTCLAEDGILFRRRLFINNAEAALHDPRTAAFSQRLSPAIAVPPPPRFIFQAFQSRRHWQKWQWGDGVADWGLPFAFDGSLYRTAQLLALFREAAGDRQDVDLTGAAASLWRSLPLMACGNEQTAIRVSHEFTTERLTEIYNDGDALAIGPICNLLVNVPAFGIDLSFTPW